MTRTLHPRHGPHDPRTRAPELAAHAVRRTTTIDMLRPEGFSGPLVLRGRGREVSGTGVVRAVAGLDVTVDLAAGSVLTDVTADPPESGLAALMGVSTSSGFRARLAEVELDRTSMLHQLLDDVPTATLVSGFAVHAVSPPFPKGSEHLFLASADQCAGWATGATILLDVATTGGPGLVTGPLRPAEPDDADELVPNGMRRERRTDVWTDDGVVHVVSWFRDSHMSDERVATVVHEYDVEVTGRDGIIATAVARARSLPWIECPRAVDSAGWLVGRRFDELRSGLRSDFIGVGTCTHLNDQLRSLADVPALL